MDVDENPETPASFGIMSIPTLLLKKDGQVVDKSRWCSIPKDQLKEMVASHM